MNGMESSAQNISWLSLGLCYLLLIIPTIIILGAYIGILRKLLIAVARMTVQLVFVGIFLALIFKLDNIFLTLAWFLGMIGFASYSVLQNTELRIRCFIPVITIAILLSKMLVLLFLNGFVINLSQLLDPRYTIALGGMLIGNSMRGNIIILNTFYGKIRREENRYRYLLSLSASRFEALVPFFRDGFRQVPYALVILHPCGTVCREVRQCRSIRISPASPDADRFLQFGDSHPHVGLSVRIPRFDLEIEEFVHSRVHETEIVAGVRTEI